MLFSRLDSIPVMGGWQPGAGVHGSTRHGLLLQGDPSTQLLLEDLPDGFARLLVHGLAQYHGLQSTTCLSAGQKAVLLQCKQASSSSSSSSTGRPSSREQEAAAAAQQQLPRQEQLSEGEGAAEAAGTECGDAAAWGLLHVLDVTCTDIVMALRELGDTLNHHSLGEYIQSSVCMRVEPAGVVV